MRVLIVDKFEMCRSGLRFALEENFPNCGIYEAASINKSLEHLDTQGIELIILSVISYLSSDHDSIAELRPYAQTLPVIVVGDPEGWTSIKELNSYNVRGFLDRSFNKDVMIAAVQLILAGGQYFPPEFYEAKKRIRSVETLFADIDMPENTKRLPKRQVEVLSAIAEGKSNNAIASELGIAPGTVKVYVSKLMRNLNAQNRTHAVSIAKNLNILK